MIEIGPDDTRPVMTPGTASCSSAATATPASCPFTTAAPPPVGLADLVAVVCTRWRIEENIRAARSLTGRDHGRVTCWNSWMRWSLISLISAALLAVALARTRSAGSPPATGLIPLTRPELLALL
jgi:SRSO17 transposase